MRKPVGAKVRIDVQVQVLSISVGCGTLDMVARLKPQLTSLTNGGRLARRNVDTLADVDGDFGLARVSVLLAPEGLDMPRAVDGVIDDPRFPLFALPGRPHPLTDCHVRLLHVAVRNLSQYVADRSAGQLESCWCVSWSGRCSVRLMQKNAQATPVGGIAALV